MRLGELKIQNYKALKSVRIPLSSFVCLIGENNAGKSSVLQALKLLIDGGTLSDSHFYDPSQSIRIQLATHDVSEQDFMRLAPEHRAKVESMVRAGSLVLVRVFESGRKSSLKYVQRVPKDLRFDDAELGKLLSGRVTTEMKSMVETRFPELAGKTKDIGKIGELRTAVDGLAKALPDDQTEPRERPLDTGIDASLITLLPEPIYIQAVKDLTDDVKTATGTPFGKILKILLDVITPKLETQKVLFDDLNAKLNRVVGADGAISDADRLEEVKLIEATVEHYVRESFANVKLRVEIPPPKLQTILSGAQIVIDDGVEGLIDTKGDGLKRAVVFSILRAFVELNRPGKLLPPAISAEDGRQTEDATSSARDAQLKASPRTYLLLFEEPELYLYPKAQQILFEALSLISKAHPVMVTTHSPIFFGPSGTTQFVKLRKRQATAAIERPFSVETLVDVSGGNERDQFQLVCYENNNIAFFADRVVLVEGDSDLIALSHIATLLRPGWATGPSPLRFAKIGGKSNIPRYKEFFRRFDMVVYVVADLDFVLGHEFGKVISSDALTHLRSELLKLVDKHIEETGGVKEPKAADVNAAAERGDLRALWGRAREAKSRLDAGNAKMDEVIASVDAFFSWEKYWPRRDALENPPNAEIRGALRVLLEELRKEQVFVWEKGAIEDYYPAGVAGDGKPARAIDCCNKIGTAAEARALCARDHRDAVGNVVSEFDAILSHLVEP